jgi:eukaryotic-like serine/threonine-protein kinase
VQSKLSNDYFVPILAFDLAGDPMWFTMPLCDRNFEAEIVEARKKNTVPKDALADIVNALEELHSLGYKHRDLKPQNVLFHDGKWKLSDFGLVLPPDGSASALTSTLSGWGTPSYCAPEQMQDFKRVSHLVDIFAFGCILHDIFDGKARIPYSQQTSIGPIGIVIEKCTELKPDRRFKAISNVRNALFTTLAGPVTLTPSVESTEWAKRLEDTSVWDLNLLHDFVRFVTDPANEADLWIVFKPLEQESFIHFARLDKDYAETVANEYCEWVKVGVFDFEFCDILVGRLKSILEFDSIDLRSTVIMSMARLAKSYNRWYVMRQLLRLCGPDMDINLAKRISIEIQVEDAYWDFVDSATRSGNNIESYHPLIHEVLQERLARHQ